jgi:hypothetical protein
MLQAAQGYQSRGGSEAGVAGSLTIATIGGAQGGCGEIRNDGEFEIASGYRFRSVVLIHRQAVIQCTPATVAAITMSASIDNSNHRERFMMTGLTTSAPGGRALQIHHSR